MTLRRICTIDGRAYQLTGHCTVCGDSMWTTIESPSHDAGCTTDRCTHSVVASDSPSTAPPVSNRRSRNTTTTTTDTQ